MLSESAERHYLQVVAGMDAMLLNLDTLATANFRVAVGMFAGNSDQSKAALGLMTDTLANVSGLPAHSALVCLLADVLLSRNVPGYVGIVLPKSL